MAEIIDEFGDSYTEDISAQEFRSVVFCTIKKILIYSMSYLPVFTLRELSKFIEHDGISRLPQLSKVFRPSIITCVFAHPGSGKCWNSRVDFR
jgi:hypothetical protein